MYSIAVLSYNLTQATPPVPGYPFYIGLGKFFNIFFNDPHIALLFISVIFSGFGAVSIYFFAKNVFNKTEGIIAALILLSSPTFYFFGITTYGYVVLPTIVSLFALATYKAYVKKEKIVLLPSLMFAVSLGFRPQDIFFNLPIFLLFFYHLNWLDRLRSMCFIIVVNLLWLFPVSQTIGGFANYLRLLKESSTSGAFPGISLLMKGFGYDIFVLRILRGIYLTLGLGLVLLTVYSVFAVMREKIFFRLNRTFIFFVFLMLPNFIFNIFLRVEHAGYQFAYLIPLIVLVSAVIVKVSKGSKKMIFILTTIIIVFNLYTFFRDRDPEFVKPYSPSSFHYSEIRKNDYKMGEKFKYINNHYSPADTIVIVGTPELFLPVAYHLEKYMIFQFDILTTTDPRFIEVWRFGYNYKFPKVNPRNKEFLTPKHIKNIILFDDEAVKWNISGNKIVDLGKSTFLSLIDVKEEERFIYGYQKFQKK